MSPEQLRRFATAGALALAVVVTLGRTVWVAAGGDESEREVVDAAWDLPRPGDRAGEAALARETLLAMRPFGGEPPPDPNAALTAESSFRLVGIVRSAIAPAAVFIDDAGTIVRIGVGEQLPDGTAVVAIDDNHVEVALEGGVRTYRIYGDVTVSAVQEDEQT